MTPTEAIALLRANLARKMSITERLALLPYAAEVERARQATEVMLGERDRIVAWLREEAFRRLRKGLPMPGMISMVQVADAIERGDHEQAPQKPQEPPR